MTETAPEGPKPPVKGPRTTGIYSETVDANVHFPLQKPGLTRRARELSDRPGDKEQSPADRLKGKKHHGEPKGHTTLVGINLGVQNDMQYEQPAEGVLSPDDPLHQTIETGMYDKVTPEQERASVTPEPIKVSDGHEEQDITAVCLNWKSEWQEHGVPEDQKVLVFLPGIGAAFDGTVSSHHVQKLAAVSDMPVMGMELPPFGSGGRLTAKQYEELKTKETTHELARNLVRAMVKKGLKHVALEGYSMGAFMAADIARVAGEDEFKDSGLQIDNLIMLEPPGVTETTLKEMSRAFFAEDRYSTMYRSAPYSYDTRAADYAHYWMPHRRVMDAKWLIKNRRRDPKNMHGQAMTHEVTPDNVERALEHNPDLQVSWAYGTLSGISPAEGNKAMYDHLSGTYGDRIQRVVYAGDTHSKFLNSDAQTWNVWRMYNQQEVKRAAAAEDAAESAAAQHSQPDTP